MHKIIYCFSGKAQSGKDFVSSKFMDALVDRGYKVAKLAFAEPLKRYLSILLDVPVSELEQLKVEENPFTANGLTVRQLMQRLGTEVFRNQVDYDFWVKQTAKSIASTNYDYYLISDCRFPNELNVINYVRECDTQNTYELRTVKILNDTHISSSGHVSENMLNDFEYDIIIDNINYSYQFSIGDFL